MEAAPADLGGPENLFNGFSVYDRPGTMIIGYRLIVGSQKFYAFAKGLQDTYRYGVINEDQFIKAAEDGSAFTGADLAKLHDYFVQWLHSSSKPTLTPADFPLGARALRDAGESTPRSKSKLKHAAHRRTS